ncbi:MAG: hypothetical protein OEN01_03410 [Candidatus Krumholzibacteria bacterium]|nr:hypothetical protein [Candidatus Krumholzibacteria bacterium]
MQPDGAVQLSFEFAQAVPDGLFVATRPLKKHPLRNSVLRRLSFVRRFFPELGGRSIRVGLTRVASGMAIPGGDEMWLNPNQVSYHAIAHEFVHLLQGRHGIPSGERSCDLFSLARHWTLNDTPPYYLRIPEGFVDKSGRIKSPHARTIYEVARRAVDLKQRGTRQYIAFFEKTLAAGGAYVRCQEDLDHRDELLLYR